MENLDEERVKVLHTTVPIVCASERSSSDGATQEPEYVKELFKIFLNNPSKKFRWEGSSKFCLFLRFFGVLRATLLLGFGAARSQPCPLAKTRGIVFD